MHARQPRRRGASAVLASDLRLQASLLGNALRGMDLLVVRDKPVLGLIGWAAVIRSSQGGHVVDLSAAGFAQGVVRTLREIEAGHWLERSRMAREWVRRHRDYQSIGAQVASDLQACQSRHAQRRMQERTTR